MYFQSPKLSLLLAWCQAVCAIVNIPVHNFSASFADGRRALRCAAKPQQSTSNCMHWPPLTVAMLCRPGAVLPDQPLPTSAAAGIGHSQRDVAHGKARGTRQHHPRRERVGRSRRAARTPCFLARCDSACAWTGSVPLPTLTMPSPAAPSSTPARRQPAGLGDAGEEGLGQHPRQLS